MLEDAGLRVVASKRIRMTREQAEGFYGVHRERPFFNDLVAFMTSGPVVVQVLEGENAVARNREIMGATNPADADEGTIRKAHAESIEANSVHGSDSDENAAIESPFSSRPKRLSAECQSAPAWLSSGFTDKRGGFRCGQPASGWRRRPAALARRESKARCRQRAPHRRP